MHSTIKVKIKVLLKPAQVAKRLSEDEKIPTMANLTPQHPQPPKKGGKTYILKYASVHIY